MEHCLAVKKLPALLRGITFEHRYDFYCLNFLFSFEAKKKIESHKRVFKNKGFCNVVMPSEDTKIYNLVKIKNLVKHQLLFMLILSV